MRSHAKRYHALFPGGSDWRIIMENKKNCSLKAIFTIIGAVVSIAALCIVLYNVFKKYFKITFVCDGDCDCCDGCCDEECFEDDCEGYEPICCCQDDEEADEDEDAE